jgi:hypothetical protein
MTNTAPTSDAVAWQRLGRVSGVAGLAAVVLILVPITLALLSVESRARRCRGLPWSGIHGSVSDLEALDFEGVRTAVSLEPY